MIGFSSANRVDMNEFAQGAAMIGTQKALGTIAGNVQPRQLTETKKLGGQGDQKAIESNTKDRKDTSQGGLSPRMDTTVQAITDMSGPRAEPEGD
jgi:hypothetical protein